MAKYSSLKEAMVAKDSLAEAELRYELLAEAFESEPKLRSQLHPAIVAAKAEITQLRALAPKPAEATSSGSDRKVVAIDANRFRKSS